MLVSLSLDVFDEFWVQRQMDLRSVPDIGGNDSGGFEIGIGKTVHSDDFLGKVRNRIPACQPRLGPWSILIKGGHKSVDNP